jgi:hypothetical protein
MFKTLPSKPSFCIIAPTAYLENYASQSRTHLALAHLIDKDPVYANFYLKMSKRGDFIICDNGAFELGRSYAPEKLIDLANKIEASCIVLPDYPFEHSQKTIDAAHEWADLIHNNGFRTMFVPQSKKGDMEDWIKAYRWAAGTHLVDMIGMSILGIPNALPHIPAAYARVVMTQILIDRGIFNFNKYHHYLGLNAGPGLEIPPLLKMKTLNSCDSSNPVWMAILGHEYTYNADSFLYVSKPKAHVQFDYPYVSDEATQKRIHHNVMMTLKIFEGE